MSLALQIVIGLIVLGFLVLIGLVVYGSLFNLAKEDQKRKLPGEDLITDQDTLLRGGKSIIINAPPEKVYPYFVQLNQTKAGFYSFQRLERLFGFHIYNTYSIQERWQHIEKGDWIFYHQSGIGTGIEDFKENRYITSLSDTRKPPAKSTGAIAWAPPGFKDFAWTWNFIFEPLPGEKTKFYTCSKVYWAPNSGLRAFLLIFLLGIPSNVMTVKMLKIVKACAEGRKN
ncbi:hypothetical protein AT727_05800 [Desulfitobacterium hafniense]|uniref:Uncharacterized protein n=1 Tax=Desulfitobacterium hafniense TaxID=49338 RepID=A0A0W1JH23_DESHA|nr:hypothetical protein [Desulfitobacterium hafniense]KTE91111.1 hypothetical protein AT727_05800 [Desulfitobacterium hafniense]